MLTIDDFHAIMASSPQGNQYFFHFTDTRNLDSIREHGLLSANERARRNVTPVATGGNEISRDADQWNGVGDYVHLCFFRQHPLEHRARQRGDIQTSVFLEVSRKALRLPGARVSLRVANKTGVEILDVADGLARLDVEVIYKRTDWRDSDVKRRLQAARLCELLILNCIPPDMIRFPRHG